MYITVLTFKTFEKAEDLKIGDVVELIKEPENEHDKNAIKVMLNNNQIGYLANNNSKITTLEGTLSASEMQDKFKTQAKAKIIEFDKNESNGYKKTFKAEFIEEKKKTKPAKSKVSFTLTGGFTTYSSKKDLITDVGKGNVTIKITKLEGIIIGEYNKKAAGKVTANEETMEIIKEYLEDFSEVTAIAYGKDKLNVLCYLEEKKAVKTKKVKINEETERVIKKGINTEEEIKEKIEYMKKCKVSKQNIGLLFESYVKYSKEVEARIPQKPKVLYVDTENLVETSMFYINTKKNLVFEGEKGVGKNVLTETLAWLYNRPLYEFSSNSQHNNNSLLGGQTFAPVEKKKKQKDNRVLANLIRKFVSKLVGIENNTEKEELSAIESLIEGLSEKNDKNLVFEMSSILEAFVNGGIIVLDEFNTSLAHVMPIFNALLDDRRRMEVTGLGQVVGHPNFCAIATQNKDYQGTFEANEATADRFEPIIFPQLTSISEILRERVPNVDYDTMALADKLYTGIKSSVETGEIGDNALTIRGFISACEVINLGMDRKQAFINSVANRASDIDDRKAIRNMIDLQVG